MLRDELVKYYRKENGYNYSCAEAMIHAANDYYGLDLPQEVMLAASSFSGGCWHNEMCGGIASALSILGIMYSVDGRAHDSEKLREVVGELFEAFEKEYGKGRCLELKYRYHNPEQRCERMLAGCADILEDIIRDNKPVNNK